MGPPERPPKIGLVVVAVDGIAVIVIDEGSVNVDVMPVMPIPDAPPNIVFPVSPVDELLTIGVGAGVAFGTLNEKAGAGATGGTSSFFAKGTTPAKPPRRFEGGSTFSLFPFVSAIFGALRLPNIPVDGLSPNPPKVTDGFAAVAEAAAVATGF